ncbi:LysR family transcriptional regulator [Paenibacillus sp. FSL H8-0548]|uniref:LysR family transcriptional regulator n=1 Tax=Paenibacillus sp. FSL H8-0548 TaxID=1920422 RepID=UPI00096E4426|nr:LysR family transcriptional regulator [Paenibacillus sp. FSL H8-0548]OMF22187.1 LysR family transcriptional regulator [Paenibacillus sp. FSL H8-0548]
MIVNMEWYRVFYWTAKTGSLSRAAEKLYITQPAVTHTIKQLEAKLGGQLFFRMAKGVKLTAEGEVLFQYIEQAYSFMETGERMLAEMHNLQSGEISIGASDTLCKHYLMPYLEQFHTAYPDIRIRVTNRTTPETISLLKEGKIDFGIVHMPAADRLLDFRTSMPLQDILVGGRAYAALGSDGMKLEAISSYPLLLLEKGASTRCFLDEYAKASGTMLSPELELGSFDLLAQFARSGFGLAFLIREYVIEELSTGELIEIPLQPPLPSRSIGIATLRGVPLSAAAKRFLELLP